MAYWLAKVKVEEETSRGSAKWTNEQFLVNAENATDAEVKLTQEYSSYRWNGMLINLSKLN